MKFFLPEEKVQNITQTCQESLAQGSLSIRQLSGKLNAASRAVLSAPIRLQQLEILSLRRSRSFNTLVTLDQRAAEKLIWWRNQLRSWNGKDVIPPPPNRDRCLNDRMRSSVPGSQNRRALVTSGERPSHQCARTVRHLQRMTRSSKNGECLGADMCLPDGGNTFSTSYEDSGTSVFRGESPYQLPTCQGLTM